MDNVVFVAADLDYMLSEVAIHSADRCLFILTSWIFLVVLVAKAVGVVVTPALW